MHEKIIILTCALNIAYTGWQKNSEPIVLFTDIMCTRIIGHLWLESNFFVSRKKEMHEIIIQWPLRKDGYSRPRTILTVCSLLVDHCDISQS